MLAEKNPVPDVEFDAVIDAGWPLTVHWKLEMAGTGLGAVPE
jgi:hypothetical protein